MTTANGSRLEGRQIQPAEPIWIHQDVLFGIDGVERALASASGLTAAALLSAKDEWSGRRRPTI